MGCVVGRDEELGSPHTRRFVRVGPSARVPTAQVGWTFQRESARTVVDERLRQASSPCSTCLHHVLVRTRQSFRGNVLKMWFARGPALWSKICHAHCKIWHVFLHLQLHEFTAAQRGAQHFDPVRPPHLVTQRVDVVRKSATSVPQQVCSLY